MNQLLKELLQLRLVNRILKEVVGRLLVNQIFKKLVRSADVGYNIRKGFGLFWTKTRGVERMEVFL